jgi:hypothetical protein
VSAWNENLGLPGREPRAYAVSPPFYATRPRSDPGVGGRCVHGWRTHIYASAREDHWTSKWMDQRARRRRGLVRRVPRGMARCVVAAGTRLCRLGDLRRRLESPPAGDHSFLCGNPDPCDRGPRRTGRTRADQRNERVRAPSPRTVLFWRRADAHPTILRTAREGLLRHRGVRRRRTRSSRLRRLGIEGV